MVINISSESGVVKNGSLFGLYDKEVSVFSVFLPSFSVKMSIIMYKTKSRLVIMYIKGLVCY